mgnify:CR=1 FL=1
MTDDPIFYPLIFTHLSERASTHPTDEDIVKLMMLRSPDGSRPVNDLGVGTDLAWRGVPISEEMAQAAWSRWNRRDKGTP